jgi:hypothetical protein
MDLASLQTFTLMPSTFFPRRGLCGRAIKPSKRIRTYVHESAIARGIIVYRTSKPLLCSLSDVPDLGRADGDDLHVLATPIRFRQRWPIQQSLNVGRDFLRAILIQDSRASKVIKFTAGRRPGVRSSSAIRGQGETL